MANSLPWQLGIPSWHRNAQPPLGTGEWGGGEGECAPGCLPGGETAAVAPAPLPLPLPPVRGPHHLGPRPEPQVTSVMGCPLLCDETLRCIWAESGRGRRM